MSKFSKKHPKLALAFSAAAKNIIRPSSLIGTGIGVGGAIGILAAAGLASGGIIPLVVGVGLAGSVASSGGSGAFYALREAKKNNQPKP
jgi:hypothetical protein